MISPAAVYANIGSSISFGKSSKSHINAWESSPAVHIWHDEWGAQAIPFNEPNDCDCISAAGIEGTLVSKIVAFGESNEIAAR